jgi:hypothetical protein
MGMKRIAIDEYSDPICEILESQNVGNYSLHGMRTEEMKLFQTTVNGNDWNYPRKKLKVDHNPTPMMPIEPAFYEIPKTAFDDLFIKSV